MFCDIFAPFSSNISIPSKPIYFLSPWLLIILNFRNLPQGNSGILNLLINLNYVYLSNLDAIEATLEIRFLSVLLPDKNVWGTFETIDVLVVTSLSLTGL